MNEDPLRRPIPALALALGLAALAHRANANAARALGVPTSAVVLLATGLIMVAGLRS